MSKINSLTIRWYDQSLHILDEVSRHETTIKRIKQQVIHRLYNDVEKKPLKETIYEVEAALIESFFSYLGDTVKISEWEADYSDFVQDGWAWEVHIRYPDRSIKKVQGTVEPPPYGKEIQAKILQLADFETEPNLFA